METPNEIPNYAAPTEARVREIVREELAGFCAMGLEKIGEDPSAPLANKLAAIFGFGLEKYGSEQ